MSPPTPTHTYTCAQTRIHARRATIGRVPALFHINWQHGDDTLKPRFLNKQVILLLETRHSSLKRLLTCVTDKKFWCSAVILTCVFQRHCILLTSAAIDFFCHLRRLYLLYFICLHFFFYSHFFPISEVDGETDRKMMRS